MSLNSNNELTARLEYLKDQASSPMTKAILEMLLAHKNVKQHIQAILDSEESPFLTEEDAQNFFYAHHKEIDQMLREYDNTSIGKLTLEFFFELQQDLSSIAFNHYLRRVLEQLDPDFPH